MATTSRSTHELRIGVDTCTPIELEPGGSPNTFRARLGVGAIEQELEVELLQGGSRPLVLVAGRVVSLVVAGTRSESQVSWKGAHFTVRSSDPGAPRKASKAGGVNPSVVAPMPGRVLQVHVAEGDPVEAGAALIVVEAMKMQNAIVSPRSGRIQRVWVVEGQSIERGAPLVDFELTPDDAPGR